MHAQAKQTFGSIPELIEHHRSNTSGLPLPLSIVVPKAHAKALVISKKLEKAWELKRSRSSLSTIACPRKGQQSPPMEVFALKLLAALALSVPEKRSPEPPS